MDESNIKLTGKRFLLLLLYAPVEGGEENTPISGRTRLMKMGFLFDRELLKDFEKGGNIEFEDMPEYFAWKYGPFSTDLLNDLEFLLNQQFIKATFTNSRPLPEETAEFRYWVEDLDEFEVSEYDEESFKLIPEKGVPKAVELWSELLESQRNLLVKFKTALNKAPLARILEYVYRNYEEEGMTRKSLIKDRFVR